MTADRAGSLSATSDLQKLFALEDKIYHALDVSGLGVVTFNDGHQFVTANSGSIQRGINAADAGDTVHVQGGHSYVENLDVNKTLTLLGANAGTAGTGTRVAESVIRAASVTDAMIEVNANNVLLNGFTVDVMT